MHNPRTLPVIVGVGQVNDRPAVPGDGMDPVAMMAEALRRAASDAGGGGGWLEDCDHLACVGQIGWPQINPVVPTVADRLGIGAAERVETTPHGDRPLLLLNEAANRIGAGEASICAVTGGEALRTAGQLAALKRELDGAPPTRADPLRAVSHRRQVGYAQSYGLVVPTDYYPLYENAARAAWGQTLAEGQAESGAIWARFNEVAANNPAAWLQKVHAAGEIVTPGEANRPIAFPYTKLQVANAAVNQGAGFIVTSLAEARARGVAEEQLIFIGHGAAAHEADDFLHRDRFDRSAGMAATLAQVMARNALAAEALDLAELYSCFPCVPKLARREIGWPLDRPASIFGGLTFGGGPIGNYMSHAIASMVLALRDKGGTGLLYANGGYATHNHAIPLSAQPFADVAFPHDFDVQSKANAVREPIPPLAEDYVGPATVETYTVFYDRAGAAGSGVVVARTPDGSRTLARVGEDQAAIAALTDGKVEPVGRSGTIARATDGLADWRIT